MKTRTVQYSATALGITLGAVRCAPLRAEISGLMMPGGVAATEMAQSGKERSRMRRFSLFASVLVVLLVGLVIAGRGSLLTLAQEGTPAAGEEVPEEITFTPLGFGTADTLPATPADFSIARFTLDPGARFDIDPSDASVTLATIESGALSVQVDVAIQVTRAATIAAFSTPSADENTVPTPEAMAADTEFIMNTGDSAFYSADITGVVRNDGQEPAVVLIASIDPQGGGATGTPAP